jgi:transcriptional antiterminator RfaH
MHEDAISCASYWYVLQTKPRQEVRAESNLRFWGVETLAPMLKERCVVRQSGQAPYRLKPLFPGYIFARFESTRLAKVRLTRGVHNVVGFGGCATTIEEPVIAFIRNRIADDGFVHIAGPQPGDLVEILDGPLKSLAGIFQQELTGRDRVLILLTSIQCHARVQVAKALIRKVDVRSVA